MDLEHIPDFIIFTVFFVISIFDHWSVSNIGCPEKVQFFHHLNGDISQLHIFITIQEQMDFEFIG
jgi:hypothetical protein